MNEKPWFLTQKSRLKIEIIFVFFWFFLIIADDEPEKHFAAHVFPNTASGPWLPKNWYFYNLLYLLHGLLILTNLRTVICLFRRNSVRGVAHGFKSHAKAIGNRDFNHKSTLYISNFYCGLKKISTKFAKIKKLRHD